MKQQKIHVPTDFSKSNKTKFVNEGIFYAVVLEKGLEPLNLSALDPKSSVFANFTTQAL